MMKKSDMITITTRECWKQWNHLSELALEIVAGVEPKTLTYEELRRIVDSDPEYRAASSVWYGMSELADKIGVDWLNAGYNTSDIETIDAREAHTRNDVRFWRLSKNSRNPT